MSGAVDSDEIIDSMTPEALIALTFEHGDDKG
jgi:hypothetical protein